MRGYVIRFRPSLLGGTSCPRPKPPTAPSASSCQLCSRLTWVWSNNNLTVNTKMRVYRACVLSTRGARSRGCPRLRFKDTCKRDLKSASIDIQSWESLAESRDSWRAAVHCGTKQAEQDRTNHLKEKRAARKRSCSIDQAATFHTCRLCGKDCHSRIGLHSHTRRCSNQNWLNLMQQSSPETEGGRRRRREQTRFSPYCTLSGVPLESWKGLEIILKLCARNLSLMSYEVLNFV